MSPFSNSRQAGESAVEYRARRRIYNKAIEKHLKGHMVHATSSIVHLPVIGIDPKVDEDVKRGLYGGVALVTRPDGTQLRIGRTKGVTYRGVRKEARQGRKRRNARASGCT